MGLGRDKDLLINESIFLDQFFLLRNRTVFREPGPRSHHELGDVHSDDRSDGHQHDGGGSDHDADSIKKIFHEISGILSGSNFFLGDGEVALIKKFMS